MAKGCIDHGKIVLMTLEIVAHHLSGAPKTKLPAFAT
jgi:hypothetical protein